MRLTAVSIRREQMAKPSYSARKGSTQVAVWGEPNAPRIQIEKRYKDKQTGDWKSTNYFFDNEVESLISLLQEAQTWIATNRTTGEDVRSVMGYNFNVVDDSEDIPF